MHPFTIVHVIAATVLLGGLWGINGYGGYPKPIVGAIAALAGLVGSIVSSLVCRWKPGLAAPGWKLWLVAIAANPVFLLCVAAVIYSTVSVIRINEPWDWLGLYISLTVTGVVMLAPALGVAARWIASRIRR